MNCRHPRRPQLAGRSGIDLRLIHVGNARSAVSQASAQDRRFRGRRVEQLTAIGVGPETERGHENGNFPLHFFAVGWMRFDRLEHHFLNRNGSKPAH
jgi:hypothetical protein